MITFTLRRTALTVAGVTTAFALSACGGGADHSGAGTTAPHNPGATAASTAPSAGAATFNDADVMFAQMMIPHHQQAVEMAKMADGKAANAEVKTLAKQIEGAQQPEIDTMTKWLTTWGKPTTPPSGGAHGSEHGGSMPGMMSDGDMKKLTAAKGAEFDKQFLTMMIAHHEGAITMANEEIAKGSQAEAKALAQQIVTAQQEEITSMKALLARV
jgi:uncharacterized protein (DUF305 family)